MTEAAEGGVAARPRLLPALAGRLWTPLSAPVRGFRLSYLPLLSVYLASGALGLIAVADQFWVKTALALHPAQLAALAGWLQLPWVAKMVLSELVDSLPIMGSQRRAYVFIGGGLIAAGLTLLAGAAGGWVAWAPPETLYVIAQMLIVVGSVVQEVVADAMSPEVVARANADGSPRAQADINRDLAMVEVLARLTYSAGAFGVALLAGLLAKALPYATVFLVGLVVPALSVAGALLVRVEGAGRRPIDWTILGGGIVLAAAATWLGLSAFRFAQEAVFLVSLAVICLMLRRVLARLDPHIRRQIALVAVMIFAFRAVPMIGDGYRWFAMDRLGFDEAFFGVLQLTSAGLGLAAMWLLADALVGRRPSTVLVWLTLMTAALFLPSLLLVNGVHLWTERALGFGARSIALIDEAAQTPLFLLATVPLLALIAVHAPRQQRATWFALVASLMSLAVVASQLATKYVNLLFPVERGAYDQLPALVATVTGSAVVIPLAVIFLLRRRVEAGPRGADQPLPPASLAQRS
jgi:BT1 family protein